MITWLVQLEGEEIPRKMHYHHWVDEWVAMENLEKITKKKAIKAWREEKIEEV